MTVEKANYIAGICRRKLLGGKIIQVVLSQKDKGRFAKILLKDFKNRYYGVFLKLFDDYFRSEEFLTKAFLWFFQVRNRAFEKKTEFWIVGDEKFITQVFYFCKNLTPEWRNKIRFFIVLNNELKETITLFKDEKIKRKLYRKKTKLSVFAKKIKKLSEDDIEIFSHGKKEIFSFHGMPFAFLRDEKLYFGVENEKQIVNEEKLEEFLQLFKKVKLYRQADSPNKKHLFYQLLPESWLESLLRRDISQIDSNLILSPVFNQFIAGNKRIDILALRKDGQLVIIELKVSPNFEHLFQAVSYWREIEKLRLTGNLRKFFPNLKIADSSAIVYLIAPKSAFHRDFYLLADLISSEIEIYRFDLNENWRKQIKVIERRKI